MEIAICQMRKGDKYIREHFWQVVVILLMKGMFSPLKAVWMVYFPTNLERDVDVVFVEV